MTIDDAMFGPRDCDDHDDDQDDNDEETRTDADPKV